jgi:spermidine synthase
MEVMLLLGYQITQGSLYTGIGLIIASFMLGLAIGSFSANRLSHVGYGTILKIEWAIIGYLLAFMLFLYAGAAVAGTVTFSLLAVLIGALTGAEFPVAGRLVYVSPWETAGTLYTADLLGGSAGAFIVSILLIPRIGIYYTCVVLVILKLLIVSALLARMKR